MSKRAMAAGFLVLAALDTVAQVGFKLAGESAGEPGASLGWLTRVFSEPWVYVALGGVLGAFMCWMTLLARVPVGPAFAASHLEIVTVLLFSVLVFGERLSFLQSIGCLLIVAGIVVLGIEEAAADGKGQPTDDVA